MIQKALQKHRSLSSFESFKKRIDLELSKIPAVTQSGPPQLYLSLELAKMLEEGEQLAKKLGDQFISPDVLLLVMAQTPPTLSMFDEYQIPKNKLQETFNELRKGATMENQTADDNLGSLDKYAQDLTKSAQDGKLDPVIGRDEEIRRAIQVLSRRTKNNPVLIGEPGVGKTAIVEGLAQRIINGDVPENLKDTRLMALDLGAMLAGAKYRGEFEERLKAVLKEIFKQDQKIVLFIDELHTLVGAGKSDGAMDASNMLKPALARGELHCIGATTLDEYRQHIEKDPALARRFQPVQVDEPTVEDSISILRGLKEKYEIHHGIRISDAAIVAACTLSNRYISDRFLPDKAIDLMDEAASRLRMIVDSKPEDIDELDRRIIQLKIEQEALKKESDEGSQKRLKKIIDDLEELEAKANELSTKWQQSKQELTKKRELKEHIDILKSEVERAQREGNLAKASEVMYGKLPKLEAELKLLHASENQSNQQEQITADDISLVVSRWTGIPVEKMNESERQKLLDIEAELHKRVVGQDEAITAIANAIRRSRSGLQDPNRPMGSFMFLGPTGVGKTEVCKALANYLFDDDTNLVRIDMSEYMEKHSVSRLIGAPPGYVGYEQGGELSEHIRRKPYSVVLFDEIEKAHPDVFNILLQVLDDGRLTDSQGRVIDFKNTIIILTSNLGAQFISEQSKDQTELSGMVKDEVMKTVRQAFRPEFLNRIDEILIFNRLQRNDMDKIVNIQLQYLTKRLKDQNITLNVKDKAISYLAETAYDPVYGARPLKRVIQRQLQDKIAHEILSGNIKDGSTISVDEAKGELKFTY